MLLYSQGPNEVIFATNWSFPGDLYQDKHFPFIATIFCVHSFSAGNDAATLIHSKNVHLTILLSLISLLFCYMSTAPLLIIR